MPMVLLWSGLVSWITRIDTLCAGLTRESKGLYTAAKEPSKMTKPSALLERGKSYLAKSYPLLLATSCCEDPEVRMLLI